MNEQYYHKRSLPYSQVQEYTVCVKVDFTRTELMKFLESSEDTMVMKIGKAIKHPDDQYNKAIGREVSKENLEEVEVRLERVIKSSDKLIFYFTSKNYFIKFRVSNKSEKPHLLEVV